MDTHGDNGDSFGLYQVRRPYHCFDDCDIAGRYTAFNADYYGGIIRSYLDGTQTWLNTAGGSGKRYKAGSLWGSIGAWYSGRWFPPGNAGLDQYWADIKMRRAEVTWRQPFFVRQVAGEASGLLLLFLALQGELHVLDPGVRVACRQLERDRVLLARLGVTVQPDLEIELPAGSPRQAWPARHISWRASRPSCNPSAQTFMLVAAIPPVLLRVTGTFTALPFFRDCLAGWTFKPTRVGDAGSGQSGVLHPGYGADLDVGGLGARRGRAEFDLDQAGGIRENHLDTGGCVNERTGPRLLRKPERCAGDIIANWLRIHDRDRTCRALNVQQVVSEDNVGRRDGDSRIGELRHRRHVVPAGILQVERDRAHSARVHDRNGMI